MTTKFILNRDINGYPSVGVPQPSINYNATLTTAHGEDTITIPSSYQFWVARLGYTNTSNVYVAVNATAAIPSGNTFAASASMLRPMELFVNAGDTISAITPDTSAGMSISLYALTNIT